jgi:hypothetical protein
VAPLTGSEAALQGVEGGGAEQAEDTVLDGGLVINRDIARRLFGYQMTGIRWMWQLHQQGAGGVVGDEMGLGKTVQVTRHVVFLFQILILQRFKRALCRPAVRLCSAGCFRNVHQAQRHLLRIYTYSCSVIQHSPHV